MNIVVMDIVVGLLGIHVVLLWLDKKIKIVRVKENECKEKRRYGWCASRKKNTVAARAYLLHLLGCILFANKSVTHVHVVFLDAF